MIHPKALVESEQIGSGTRVWAFAHILPGAIIGSDCNVCDGVFIENDVVVGDRVTIKCGVQLWDGIRVEDDVFIGPNATFTNDPNPRSKQRRSPFVTTIREGASIGANATILPGVEIGRMAMVGAGAVVTHDVGDWDVVVGNPARILPPAPPRPYVMQLRTAKDRRGELAVVEHLDLPFEPLRTFVIHSVPTPSIRGEHAHRTCHQFLVCINGSVKIETVGKLVDTQTDLTSPESGLYIPPMHWAVLSNFSDDAVLLVLASHPYDENDYIRDYDEFEELL